MYSNRLKGSISLWRTNIFKVSVAMSFSFILCVALLLTSTYIRTTDYLKEQGDQIILGQANFLKKLPVYEILRQIEMRSISDLRGVNYYGVFDASGKVLGGNVSHLPQHRGKDGVPTDLNEHDIESGSRVVTVRLEDNNYLLVGYNALTLDGITHILMTNFLSYGLFFSAAGILFGYFIARKPVKRIIILSGIIQTLKDGELSGRFPVSRSGDELDAMCTVMNGMLDEIEHLLEEMKNVSKNIAHDLRSPLASLNTLLIRMKNDWAPENYSSNHTRLALAIEYTGSLLNRFRALQRIAEIESKARNSAMSKIEIHEFFDEIDSLFSAYAEEQGVQVIYKTNNVSTIYGDKHLLIEAIYNLIDNALKYADGTREIILSAVIKDDVLSLSVEDSGKGIRDLALHDGLYHKGSNSLKINGTGLGLSIVSAVAHMHGSDVLIENRYPGLRVTMKGTFWLR